MSKRECGCVGVLPDHMKVILGLGSRRVKIKNKECCGTTAEELQKILKMEEGPVFEALDDLMGCNVVKDVEITVFYLTKQGEDLFRGMLDAVTEINK